MDNMIINHDMTVQTLINIKIDNKNINIAALNKFLIELEELTNKYNSVQGSGITYVR